MGEIADDLIDRMWDDDNNGDDCVPYYGRSYYRNSSSRLPKKKKPKVKEYPEKTFDMSFFPTNIPKPRTIVPEEPKEQATPDPWATDGEEAPF